MSRKLTTLFALLMVVSMLLAACAPAAPAPAAEEAPAAEPAAPAAPAAEEPTAAPAAAEPTAAPAAEEPAANLPAYDPNFFDQAAYETELKYMTMTPEGDAATPWLQYIDPKWVDTSAYKKDGPYTLCFSNAGVFNPWRQSGFTTMTVQAEVLKEQGVLKDFIVTDAEGKDEKQIADIKDLLASGKCDVLIVSPNTTEALTPAVEEACKTVPTIVFDRGVNTDCPVSFITAIGGYAFGAAGAEFIAENIKEGGKVLAIRIAPGIDVLEHRWSAAYQFFKDKNIEVVGMEFTGDKNDKTKAVVEDYIDRYGTIDAIWMDAGATTVAAIEAFEDRGLPIPIVTGEDQMDYLAKWKETGMTGIAPVFSNFQWRTPVLAAVKILQGEQVPARWTLPQPVITNENLDQYYNANMPPQAYAMCGCEDLPGYPEKWGGKK